MAADTLADRIDITLPEDRDYATVAGFALAVFRHLPVEGESFVEQGWRFEIVDLDGRRIDKVLVERARKGRSEEHTSELQSLMRRSYAVFCLKKKRKQQ